MLIVSIINIHKNAAKYVLKYTFNIEYDSSPKTQEGNIKIIEKQVNFLYFKFTLLFLFKNLKFKNDVSEKLTNIPIPNEYEPKLPVRNQRLKSITTAPKQ